MKIGIISDTHKKLEYARDAIDMLLENGAEFFVHAGDIVQVETLELLKNSSRRYVGVYGNNDAHLVPFHNNYNLVQEPHYFKLAKTTFKLMHLPFYMNPDTQVVISGHTHTFHAQMSGGTLFINSGEVCARSKDVSECAMLEILEESFLVTHFTKKVEKKTQKSFKAKTFTFKREKQ